MLASAWFSACLLAPPSAPPAHGAHAAPAVHSAAPLDEFAELLAGNRRFVLGRPRHPHQDRKWVKEQVRGQHPGAVVVGCADSRVPVEMIFDQGVGDLFVIRAAGNVVDSFGLASIEYAVEHLGVQNLLVLGHEKCGAVGAAIESLKPAPSAPASHDEDPDEPGPSSIASLVAEIAPSVQEAQGRAGDLAGQAVIVNARRSMERILEKSPMLKHRVLVGKLKIACGVYSLETGAVRWTEKPAVTGGFVRVSPAGSSDGP